jgi:hypothetical protein
MTRPFELLQPLSEVVCRPVSFLWPGRLGHGKLSIFEGDPGPGKSLVTLDLCARITTGRPFPMSDSPVNAGNVIILSSEDATDDTVAPRLRTAGANLERVLILRKDLLDRVGPFRLPTHCDVLDRAVAESHAVLVVVDPITDFLDPSINIGNDQSVRRALSPLGQIANQHGCHVTLLRHLNKSGHFRSIYRGGGSIGFLAACRSAFLFGRDPHDPLRSVMAQVKNNLGPLQPSLAYRIQAQPGSEPVIEWLGESPLSADQLLAAAGLKPALPGPRDRARDFLFAFLDAGPRTTLDIWQAAQELGHSQRTLRRVRRQMKIRSQTVTLNGRVLTYWLLPGQQLPLEANAPDAPSLEPWLAPLREQYPVNPLADE